MPTTYTSEEKDDGSYIKSIDYDASGNVVYYGVTTSGTAKSAAKWQIKKFSYTSNDLTDIQWADGNTKFDNVWDDRASLSYS